MTAAKNIGVTLVLIPFWWDRSKESLSATIHQFRPDLVPVCEGIPIPDSNPSSTEEYVTLPMSVHWFEPLL
jgi:hypothetical protein